MHNEAGLYLVRLGRLDEAAEHLTAALRGVRAAGPPSEAAVLDSLGELEHARGRFAAAVDYFQQTLPLVRKRREATTSRPGRPGGRPCGCTSSSTAPPTHDECADCWPDES